MGLDVNIYNDLTNSESSYGWHRLRTLTAILKNLVRTGYVQLDLLH